MTYLVRNAVYNILCKLESSELLLTEAIEEEKSYMESVENLTGAAEKQAYASEVIWRMNSALSALRESIASLEAIEEGE